MSEVMMWVDPAAGGWWVGCDLPIEPTYFRSGACAEAAARDLAIRLRNLGHEVRLVVRDDARQVVQTRRYFA